MQEAWQAEEQAAFRPRSRLYIVDNGANSRPVNEQIEATTSEAEPIAFRDAGKQSSISIHAKSKRRRKKSGGRQQNERRLGCKLHTSSLRHAVSILGVST